MRLADEQGHEQILTFWNRSTPLGLSRQTQNLSDTASH